MIDVKKYIKLFNDYYKTFDIKEKMLLKKFHHTYRVMEFAKEIAISESLNENDIKIVELCGLFHDVARFKQATLYKTYIDNISFDHGDMGYEILLETGFIADLDEEVQNIILKSVINHNKLNIDPNLNDRELLFVNIIRDADKLDIMKEQGYAINDNKLEVKKEVIDCILNKELVVNNYVETDVSRILRIISFIYDFNFKYSFKFLEETNLINKKFLLLEANLEDNSLEEVKNYVNAYLEGRN